MEFKGLKKVNEGRFITRYDLDYETVDGKPKTYEMISRRSDLVGLKDMAGSPTDSVVLIMTDESGERILLNREFRMPIGRKIMNFPAGLIDPGEGAEEAGRRELREETGLEIISIDDVLRDSFSAIGFSNEKSVCLIGRAAGEFTRSTSSEEEIWAGWYTREEVRALLRREDFSARSQAYCYMWAKSQR